MLGDNSVAVPLLMTGSWWSRSSSWRPWL